MENLQEIQLNIKSQGLCKVNQKNSVTTRQIAKLSDNVEAPKQRYIP